MEGRTLYNYGTSSYAFTMKDINYLLGIINSQMDEEQKAIELFSFCNESAIKNNINIFNSLGLKEVSKIKEIYNAYKEYEEKGLYKLVKNAYKCTLGEIAVRLNKLHKVQEIIFSDEEDYIKVDKLLSLFKNANDFRKSYSLFIKFGKDDSRLDSAREALDNFDVLYTKFKEYEEKGLVDNIKYVKKIEDFINNYTYAEYIITLYVESSESYKEYAFLQDLEIDKDYLEFCASTICELNPILYQKYLEKKELNNKIRCLKNSETIKNLATGIKTGVMEDGTEFDFLEFMKRIPFKRSMNLISSLTDFMQRNNPKEENTILSYVYSNNLHKPGSPFKLKDIYETEYSFDGIKLTKEDKDAIIDYLNINYIPLSHKTFLHACRKYTSGLITPEMIQNQKEEHESLKLSKKKRTMQVINGER